MANNLFDRIRIRKEAHPDKPLFVFLDERGEEIERHTYQTFWNRVHSIAAHLHNLPELSAGDRILLLYPPGLEFICALFACVRAGLVPAPTNAPASYSRTPSLRRMESIASDCEPSLLLTNGKGTELLSSTINDKTTSAADVPHAVLALEWLNTDEIATEPEALSREALSGAVPSDLFLIQYTSGSTSRPKGVMVSVENVLANSVVVDHEDPVAVSWLPQHHDMGLLGYYVYILLHGGTTYGFSTASFIQRPILWLETISRFKGTCTSVPNFALEMCLNKARVSDASVASLRLDSLRILMAAAEPINAHVYEEFFERFRVCGLNPKSFFVAYGLAENTLAVSNYGRQGLRFDRQELASGRALQLGVNGHSEQEDGAVRLMSCGRPLEGNHLLVVDPDTLEICDDQKTGEVWVSGASKCRGYWNNQEASEHTFLAVPKGVDSDRTYLRTGDIGFLLDGELFICGREKEMIVIRGENYFPRDIELVVKNSVASFRPRGVAAFEYTDNGHARVAVVVEIRPNGPKPDVRAILGAVRASLGLEIDSIVFVPSKTLPKTTSGKLMRLETKKMWMSGNLQALESYQHNKVSEDDLSSLASAQDLHSFIEILKREYNITGEEDFSIVDTGIDSIELVSLLGLIKADLEAKGAQYLAEKVDIRLLQAVSISQLFQLSEMIQHATEERRNVTTNLIGLVEQIRNRRLDEELRQMRADATFPRGFVRPIPAEPRTGGDILLSGGTGFLGPFLLCSLLDLHGEERRIQVIVRAGDPNEAYLRLRSAFARLTAARPELVDRFDRQVHVLCGDLSEPSLGLKDEVWQQLRESVTTIYHNGATVNYLLSYGAMRDVNVKGTEEILRLAFDCGVSDFNYISTTFIFGWTPRDLLLERDCNAGMDLLDFGYSQSKWVAEQLVFSARDQGLPVRVFRPSLITPSVDGDGSGFDITLRLLAFMIKYGVGVNSQNQISFTPADVTARNIIAICQSEDTIGGTFHVVRDDYSNMMNVTDLITDLIGRRFDLFPLKPFVTEVVDRCTPQDLLYPLIDFLVGSVSNISAMEFKRYDSTAYQQARDASGLGLKDPSMHDTIRAIVTYLQAQKVI